MTVAELASRIGDVPLWRIQTDPLPGTGTESDVERVRCERGALCELIDGVLVEKAVSYETAFLASEILVDGTRWCHRLDTTISGRMRVDCPCI
jgi:hypothetical protein